MIDPRELRIGNLFYEIDRANEVHLPIESPLEIREIRYAIVRCTELDQDPTLIIEMKRVLTKNISPIPLTEEWLLKFGFQYNGNVLILKLKDGVFDEGNSIEYFKGEDYTEIKFGYYGNSKIKYVHQLQNLYYALTGEELTIK